MTQIAEIEASDGTTILAEIQSSAGGDVGIRDKLKLDDATETIEEVARWVHRTLQSGLPDRPERVGVEFGLKLAVKSGALVSVLAEASGEASLVIKLEWSSHS